MLLLGQHQEHQMQYDISYEDNFDISHLKLISLSR